MPTRSKKGLAKKRIFISCIEASADRYAAAILKKIQHKKYEWQGYGGPELKKILPQLKDISLSSSIGFWEPIKKMGFWLREFKLAQKTLEGFNPDFVWVTDAEGFHLPLIAAAKKLNAAVKVIYLIAPQVWQWGKEKEAHKFIGRIDLVLDIFPEATNFYKKIHPQAFWIGHPLVDMVHSKLKKREDWIAVFPGSRKSEIENLLPIFCQAVQPFQKNYQIKISCLHASTEVLIQRIARKYLKDFQIDFGNSYDLIQASAVCLTSSGTITLEMSLLQTPFVAAYKTSSFNFWLSKKILGMRFPKYIAWPNLMAGKKIVPEFLQEKATCGNLRSGINLILDSDQERKLLKSDLKTVARKLGQKGALRIASKKISKCFEQTFKS